MRERVANGGLFAARRRSARRLLVSVPALTLPVSLLPVSLLAVALMTTAAPAVAEVEVSEQARALFREGVQALKDPTGPQYAVCYEKFKAAYADSPSPKILGNLGLCATNLERDGEAIEAYRAYLDEAGAKSPTERKQISADLEKLEKRVAWLRLTVSPADATIVDERETAAGAVVNRYSVDGGEIRLGLRAGSHRLTIRAEGHEPSEITLELGSGSDQSRAIELTPIGSESTDTADDQTTVTVEEPDDDDGLPVALWVGVGGTAALAVATGVVGGLAADNHSSYEDAIATGDAAGAADHRDSGQTLNIVGDVLLGTAIAAAAATTIGFIVVAASDDDETSARLTPIVTPNGAWVGLEGAF